ncbi:MULTISPECIES: ubiquitin-like protein Pup [Corynebacterium]|uniref:Prokaryotic ubiquitin-like protein Pup n=1 Tax=Corynebacterium freneyi TaxID=134034 RepID=A0ABS4U8G3_9CORY|nr:MULTISPECIES: ubiquitin-like protein Pup [Corynebacterium]MBP2332469.1 ubiquitin-like protein Pup [Corynebacterium freneyi]MCG7437938.1 ubiquitin-like protein Pup [Corynebacterium freneyi]MDK8767908.1 ubiquitin-like protein Pup [Corynebacterium freneyi]OFU53651.1 ubiquitin [Corynebacterium sp. HMSC11E11]QXA53349.1 ubiquitin-like protein Pup [Corynebacterium freneyi]
MADIKGGQIQGGGGSGGDDEIDEISGGGQAQAHIDSTDDLLDEIDGLLENNAEEFVRSYVQKGGE